jgi:hypothetical protein
VTDRYFTRWARHRIARKPDCRRDQPFWHGSALNVRTQFLFREPSGFLFLFDNLGDGADVET